MQSLVVQFFRCSISLSKGNLDVHKWVVQPLFDFMPPQAITVFSCFSQYTEYIWCLKRAPASDACYPRVKKKRTSLNNYHSRLLQDVELFYMEFEMLIGVVCKQICTFSTSMNVSFYGATCSQLHTNASKYERPILSLGMLHNTFPKYQLLAIMSKQRLLTRTVESIISRPL